TVNRQSGHLEDRVRLRRVSKDKVFLSNQDVTHKDTYWVVRNRVAYIPEDRIGLGIIGEMTISDNLILERHGESDFAGRFFLKNEGIDKYADEMIRSFNIKCNSKYALARHLSGGNLQRLILARELSRQPQLILAAQPTK